MKFISMNSDDCLYVLKNSLPNDINKIIQEYTQEGINIYYKNTINNPGIIQCPNNDLVFNYWSYSIYITCNLLYFKNITIQCPFTNNNITSIYSGITGNLPGPHTSDIYTYYKFETCTLVCGGGYNLPCFIYSTEKNIYFNITRGEFNSVYGDSTRNEIIIKEIEKQKVKKGGNKIVLSFANNYQIGHYLWNEISGIDILIRTKLIKNIDILLLNDYDICEAHKTIQQRSSCEIVAFKDRDKLDGYHFGTISGYFILDATKQSYFNHVNPIKLYKKTTIMIIIKADRRPIINIETVFINIINKLVENKILIPNETAILFDGLYRSDANDFLKDYYKKHNNKYHSIVEKIIKNIDSSFNCKSLIGLSFIDTLGYYNNIDFWVGPGGCCVELINQTHKNGICIITNEFTYGINQQCCYIENRINRDYCLAKHTDLSLTIFASPMEINWNELYDCIENNIIKIIYEGTNKFGDGCKTTVIKLLEIKKFHPKFESYSFQELNDIKKKMDLQNEKYFNHVEVGGVYSIRTEEFYNFYKVHEKVYFVYDKNTFYKFYKNFDLDFYRERYFNDQDDKDDIDILVYYHTEGVHLGHKINKKRRLLFYTISFDKNCGGVLCSYNTAKIINETSNSFYTEMVVLDSNRLDNPVYTNYLIIPKLIDDDIVIYPEVITGNPLNAKYVVRWILLELGIEMPIDHYKTFGPNDLIYEWDFNAPKVLCKSYFNPVFQKKQHYKIEQVIKNGKIINKKIKIELERLDTCYIVKKGRLYHHGNIKFTHPENSINIEEITLHEELNEIFNKCKYFYCYDPTTFFIAYAIICGCIPIIYPIQGMTKNEYKIKFTKGNGMKTFAYGDEEKNDIDIKKSMAEIKNGFKKEDETIALFLKDLENTFTC